jgi:hypothetical protein
MTNYNESRIYKIWCNLQGVDEIYIGSSARFIERCKLHESDCNNINSPRYSYKLYQYIRNNGGFQNFKIHVIEEFPCENRTSLNIREEYWKKELQPTLNTNRAYRTEEELKEDLIQYRTDNPEYFKQYRNQYRQQYPEYFKQNNNNRPKGKFNCSNCDKTYTYTNKKTHLKSKYCKNYKSTASESSTESIINSDTDVE